MSDEGQHGDSARRGAPSGPPPEAVADDYSSEEYEFPPPVARVSQAGVGHPGRYQRAGAGARVPGETATLVAPASSPTDE
jgi:hypothetical protein